MASVPSSTALATSLASARVGRGLRIIESSICVAVITGLAAAWHLLMIIFCTVGTVSGLVSMPRSPRATMIASDASMMASMLRTASGFSILAITGIARPKAELLWMMDLSSMHLVRLAHKAERDPVDLVIQGELDIFEVLVRQRRDVERGVGQVHALVALEHPGEHDPGADLGVGGLQDFQLEQPSSSRMRSPGLTVRGQILVLDRDAAGYADHILGGQDRAPVLAFQGDAALLHLACAQLWPLEVGQDGDGFLGCSETVRTRSIVSAWYSWVPWLKLSRATFMPPAMIRRRMGNSRLAGPMVQMILTRSMA